ncbi:MAG: BamA/OMP85 family outer membrane protein [Calditrichota bacterium]
MSLRTLSLPLIILALTAPLWATVDLSLEDYRLWQGYNGWRIQVVVFPGIKSFSRAELLTVMATEKPTWLRRYIRIGHRTVFFADDFTADLFRVEHFYRREGFPNSIIRGYVIPREKTRELVLKVEIVEGQPLVLESWNIELNGPKDVGVDSARWSLLMPIKTGERLALSAVKSSADTLAYKLREIGHARAHVGYEIQTDSLRNTAHVMFVLSPGDFCYLGQTRIIGLKQLRESTARRELVYRDFEPFSPKKLEETRRRLVKLEIFNYVSIRADTSVPGDTLPVWIETQEGWRYRMRLGGGYDTEEHARTSAEFVDLNFFGRGRRFTWSGSWAELHRQTEIRLFWPHTPWNATDLTIAPKWAWDKQPNTTLETQSATTILSSSPLPFVNLSLSNEVGPAQAARQSEADSTLKTTYIRSVETISAAWDTRDNPLIPRKGHVISMTLAESGAFYRTDFRWWRAVMANRVFVPATRFTVLAGKTEVGMMGPLHDSPVTPPEERFYLGGAATIRGWARDKISPRSDDEQHLPVGGDFYFYFTTEIRQNVWGPVTLAAFSDVGNVWTNKSVWQPLNLYPSAGLGLLFITPVGPIRIDYAHQIRKNPYGDRPYAIHFSLGMPF